MSHLNARASRAVAAIAALSAFAAAPMVAQAADTDADGTLNGGSLTVTAPSIAPFSATLTGVAQTVTTAVGLWTMTDATGTNLGYDVTASATAPTVDGDEGDAGTGGSLSLMPKTATRATGNLAPTGPSKVGSVLQSLPETGVTAVTIQTAIVGTGQGAWNVAADVGAEKSLSVVVPGDASAGDYSSTLTYTIAALA
jgi:hypothetical protein